jgi:hypothetical protein
MLLLLTRGRDAVEELQALSAKIAELAAGQDVDLALFAELADLVDTAREHEERAVELLSAEVRQQ